MRIKPLIITATLLGSLLPFTVSAESNTPVSKTPQVTASAPSFERININTASAEELSDRLSGVGLAKAQAIVDYRQQHGPFSSVQQMVQVKGIGPAIVTKNQSRIVFR